jgi:benzoate membrane transport protein
LVEPDLLRPDFQLRAILEQVLPLMLTVIGIQNAQGFFVLRQSGYRPPANSLTLVCGVGTGLMAPLGTVPLCVTGPANAILNTSGPRELRFMGGVVFGVLMLLFGLFAPVTVGLALALPAAFIAVLGGLAMWLVLQGAFIQAFSGRFALGALLSFVVTLSGITILNIGAPFWGLVVGYLASRLLERKDFQQLNAE